MNGPEHYRRVEELLAAAEADEMLNMSITPLQIEMAKAHATLALAAATALAERGPDAREWAETAGTKLTENP